MNGELSRDRVGLGADFTGDSLFANAEGRGAEGEGEGEGEGLVWVRRPHVYTNTELCITDKTATATKGSLTDWLIG